MGVMLAALLRRIMIIILLLCCTDHIIVEVNYFSSWQDNRRLIGSTRCAGVGELSWSIRAFKSWLCCMPTLLHCPSGIGFSAAVGSLLFASIVPASSYASHHFIGEPIFCC
jgi:hypothetical protein